MYKPVLVHAKEQIDLMLCFDKKNDAEKDGAFKIRNPTTTNTNKKKQFNEQTNKITRKMCNSS